MLYGVLGLMRFKAQGLRHRDHRDLVFIARDSGDFTDNVVFGPKARTSGRQ